ncbi:hypothetical protein H1P_1150017 [Hyella patelloides LEGE 07179]|uniref:Uncharacterized protein n=1 Tax=Hyella patelloides LEGE 07179 TaxID=945734 RepID=A0A563VK46_9CYAN|nr:hypothetical protein H1P_1150017 [Hyella patelloides LEGE 07179]
MGGLQQTAINCGQQNIKPEKSPLSTPAEVSSAKERAPREDGACGDRWSSLCVFIVDNVSIFFCLYSATITRIKI